jgi:hypothetical protein
MKSEIYSISLAKENGRIGYLILFSVAFKVQVQLINGPVGVTTSDQISNYDQVVVATKRAIDEDVPQML